LKTGGGHQFGQRRFVADGAGGQDRLGNFLQSLKRMPAISTTVFINRHNNLQIKSRKPGDRYMGEGAFPCKSAVSAALNLSILPKSAADDKMNIEGNRSSTAAGRARTSNRKSDQRHRDKTISGVRLNNRMPILYTAIPA
jgi:hypothetical protein